MSSEYPLAVKTTDRFQTIVELPGRATIGSDLFCLIAGPCAVENREQLLAVARAVKQAGAHALRGGAFKPRSSPYDFQGLGREGLVLLAEARRETGLPIVTELLDVRELASVAEVADVIQIGSRSSANSTLLKEVGRIRKPVLLKRGMAMTLREWLLAAEYILKVGNRGVILCERGIRTFEPATRHTLDLSAIPLLKMETHLPVIVDPSHATGRPELIPAMVKAALAAGADGAMVEVHPDPARAASDGPQALTPAAFQQLVTELKPLAQVMQRRLTS